MSGKRRNFTNGPKWEDKYLYNGQLSTSRCISTLLSCSSSSFVFNIKINGSVLLFQKIGNIPRSGDDLKRQACMRQTWCWQIMTSRPRGTVCPKTRQTRNIQRKALLFGYSPSQIIWRTWRHMRSHIPLKERKHRFGRWCFKSAEHKVLNEGRESRNNHRIRSKVHQSRRRSQKLFIRFFHKNLASTGMNYHGIIEQLHFIDQKTSESAERAVRREKGGTSAVLLQSGSDDEWWSDSMKCCCYLRDDQNLLTDGKSQKERRYGE